MGGSFPFVPGYAAVFEVESIGDSVAEFQPGDLAFTMGPHRSRQRCTEGDAIRVPASLNALDATFARMMCVSMTTLTTTTARPPQPVLITGLGPVGHLAALVFASV